jgi:hypothetical protein
VVAAGEPAAAAGFGQDRVDLGGVQEAHDGPVAAFGRDGQDPADLCGVLGYVQRGVAEQGADRGQPGVAVVMVLARPVSRCWRNAVISG